MITITDSSRYRRCRSCNEKDNVKDINYSLDGSNHLTAIALCKACREKLKQLLSEGEDKHEQD